MEVVEGTFDIPAAAAKDQCIAEVGIVKRIGAVDGWQSTVLYYSVLCRKSEQWLRSGNAGSVLDMPEISIQSLNLTKAVAYLDSGEDEQSWTNFDNYHRTALEHLEATGADFALRWPPKVWRKAHTRVGGHQ